MYTYDLAGKTVTVLSHEAMATIFELHLVHDDNNYMAQAALEAFSDLHNIEHDLSRFLDNSDITRINKLKPGESTIVSLHTFSCLKTSIEYYHLTDKIFNVGLGRQINILKNETQNTDLVLKDECSLENLELNEDDLSVYLKAGLVNIDLGGVGKGYAIDYLKDLLCDWNIHQFLIQGGQSSVLATEAPGNLKGWPVSLSYPQPPHEQFDTVHLQKQTLSSSGLQKNNHIFDPRSNSVANNQKATWVMAPNAIDSDILSTTFMLLSKEEIEEFSSEIPKIAYICIDQYDKIFRRDKATK
jgi:FAD:protein FMN transferase